MLNKFEQWVNKYTVHTVIYNNNELSNSIVIDFENDRYISRFTVWDDLSCMSEVMDVDTGLYKLNKRNEFSTFDELLDIFNIFLINIK
ncbi:hypothetical protein AVA06_001009 [Salmonella enterica subsp. enterica]|nr:hypothetical protein [Salmonella enterica subsp. enterica]EDW9585746.1 hypothetical protein [Salmonella enterica subsp. enterica]EED9672492.1 hypothetical protein [Salmonella enterica subsp. enterica]